MWVLCVYDANKCHDNTRKDGVGGVVPIGLPNARHKLEDYKSPHGIVTESDFFCVILEQLPEIKIGFLLNNSCLNTYTKTGVLLDSDSEGG